MDSLTQVALGAAVGVAVMQRRTAPWKAALWGGVAGTLPDLDVLLRHGDPILEMVLHRAESHASFWLTLVSLPFAALVARLHGEWALRRRWWLAIWLALVTHPLLDGLTIYGTRLLLPFSDRPLGLGSVFVIDPMVTVPWLAGVIWALAARGSPAGLRANAIGLLMGCAYLAAGVGVQQQVQREALASLAAQGVQAERLIATPAAFSIGVWRVLAVAGDHHDEAVHALADAPGPMAWRRFDRGAALDAELRDNLHVQRVREFSRGFYALSEARGQIRVSDLRMGLAPHYTFSFVVAERGADGRAQPLPVARAVGGRPDLTLVLPWWWQRMQGRAVAMPP
ncbi:MAG: metal-dependent hydrolase [Rubrivivax sp.]